MGRGKPERAGTGGRCRRGTRKQSPIPLYRALRPGWGAVVGTVPGTVPHPAKSLRPPPHSAAAGGCRVGGKCWGWGRPSRSGGGGGGEARRLLAPSSARDSAAAAESLSLGHVIVSKRELRGSRRLGDHYKTQSGERIAATAAAAAAASPAPDRPGRAAATERPGPAPRPPGARRSPSACAPRPAPPPLLRVCKRAPRLQKPTNFPPTPAARRPPTALPPGSAASCRREGRRGLPESSSLLLTSPLLSRSTRTHSGLRDGSTGSVQRAVQSRRPRPPAQRAPTRI